MDAETRIEPGKNAMEAILAAFPKCGLKLIDNTREARAARRTEFANRIREDNRRILEAMNKAKCRICGVPRSKCCC